MAHDDRAELRRFAKWARRIRFIGRFLCRTTHQPELLPEHHGRPVVMVANHRSLADVFVAVEALDFFDMPARCLVRAKFFEIPLLGRWFRAIGCIPAGDGKRGSVDLALETLESGRPVAIMIEGKIIPPEHRQQDGLGEFRPGFLEIARAARAVILPIALVGTDEVWPSTSKLPRVPWRGRPDVHVRLGEVIDIDDLTDEQATAATRAAMAAYIAAVG